MAFGGHITGRTYGTATTGKPRLNLLTLQTTLEQAWQRLANVNIECMDFRDLIKRYDRPHTLFYLDPPYWDLPGYNHDFEEQDFKDLAELLAGIKGKFLMSFNDTPEIRMLFGQFQIDEVKLKYSLTRSTAGRNKTRTELLISNG
jgi:DNA adenine methylase